MRLVGATNWFIRTPFIIEAVFQSLVGGVVAIVTLFVFHRAFFDTIHKSIPFFPVIPTSDLFFMIPILIGIGVFTAILASFVAMRRFLEV